MRTDTFLRSHAAKAAAALVGVVLIYWFVQGAGTRPDPVESIDADITAVASIPATSVAASQPLAISADPESAQDTGDTSLKRFAKLGAQQLVVTKVTPSHYRVKAGEREETGGFYVLLSLSGVAGQTVRIDLEGEPFTSWGKVIPQYSYLPDLDAFAGFVSTTQPIAEPRSEYAARAADEGRAALPDTNGQQWHYVQESSHGDGRLTLTQKFEQNEVFVALRVPYSPGYNQAFLQRLESNPNVSRFQVGTSAGGRRLDIVKIPAGLSASDRVKPCVLMHAREHPDEQDCSWIAQGAIEFLASDDPVAKRLRDQFTFLVIPLLDPDGAVRGVHENIINDFTPVNVRQESLAYASWFKRWADDGRRLDVVMPLHNPPPGSAFHVACPMMDAELQRLKHCQWLHAEIRGALLAAGLTARNTPWTNKHLPMRLGGWIADCYGALVLPYEVNSLTPKRQLNLAELRQLGKILAVASGEYLSSKPATELFGAIDKLRESRAAAFKRLPEAQHTDDTVALELRCRAIWRSAQPPTSSPASQVPR